MLRPETRSMKRIGYCYRCANLKDQEPKLLSATPNAKSPLVSDSLYAKALRLDEMRTGVSVFMSHDGMLRISVDANAAPSVARALIRRLEKMGKGKVA